MNFDSFQKIVEKVKKNRPIWFGLGHDRIPDKESFDEFKRITNIDLPGKYIEFLSKYGGGYFGFAIIYSLDKNSHFFLLSNNELPIKDHLNIGDNGCGDYYVLYIRDGKCEESVYLLDHEDGKMYETEYNDIYEYLIKAGLKQ